MTITLTELARDEQGRHRVIAAATLGEGTRKVLGIHEDLEQARELARHKAEREERWLAANETHSIEELEGITREGHRTLRAPDGTLVEATEQTVPALLAAGYVETEGIPQRTDEHAGPVEVGENPKRRGRRPQPMDGAGMGDGDEME